MKKVTFYIDGQNFFHALDSCIRKYNLDIKPQVNWLTLAKTFLRQQDNEVLTAINYFSAFYTPNIEIYRQQQRYVSQLQQVGVNVILGKYKVKKKYCPVCKKTHTGYEEKETDINIALRFFADAVDNNFDRAVLVSADTDLVPLIKLIKNRFPDKTVSLAIPPQRDKYSKELIQNVNNAKRLTFKRIRPHIL